MKKYYPTLTFLTGILLVTGVLFVRFYGGPANASQSGVTDQTMALATGTGKSTAAATAPSGTKATTHTASGSAGKGSGSSASVPTSTKPAGNTSGFTNGTYSGSAQYETPESIEGIRVSLTISNGVVTDASVSNSEGGGTSRRYQGAFASTYRSYVIGKSLSSLQLYRVAGASLTTAGFNAAVDQIRSEAAA